jgi:enoyl-CoA hydratase/carnithine racemase
MNTGQAPELIVDGHVATITLRRPAQANRLEVEDLHRLLDHFTRVNASPEILVLRLAAAGRSFCSGFNIGSVGAEGVDAGALFAAVADGIEALLPVTIAAIQGGIYGGATDLALACDFRIGTPACEMFVPAAKLGLLFYLSGQERCVSRLGLGVAKRLLLQADTFNSQQMLDCGFLDRLVAQEALEAQVETLTATLAGMAPLALLGMKKHLNRIARGTVDAAEFAHDVARAGASDDLREGQLAWQQRRTPRFCGR